MIDLHTHTTASDGRCEPADLVARAAAAGVTVLGVTDHDTVAGCDAAARACRGAGIAFVPGIEMTAMRDGIDVHVLGYFVDTGSHALLEFLAAQRRNRLERVRQIVARLGGAGIALDAEAIVAPAIADPSKAAGRPWVARALVAAGHVASTTEAFDRWLGRACPAYVPRDAPTPSQVVRLLHECGALVSLAHPGLLGQDAWIPDMIHAGLDAIEAYHSDHPPDMCAHYLALAACYGTDVSGGSDFHGDPAHGPAAPGVVSLPSDAFERLVARHRRAGSRGSQRG